MNIYQDHTWDNEYILSNMAWILDSKLVQPLPTVAKDFNDIDWEPWLWQSEMAGRQMVGKDGKSHDYQPTGFQFFNQVCGSAFANHLSSII